MVANAGIVNGPGGVVSIVDGELKCRIIVMLGIDEPQPMLRTGRKAGM
jgi:hypothetical protein